MLCLQKYSIKGLTANLIVDIAMPYPEVEDGKSNEKVPLLGVVKSKRKQKLELEKYYTTQRYLQEKFEEDAQLLEKIGNPDIGHDVEGAEAKVRRDDRILAQVRTFLIFQNR